MTLQKNASSIWVVCSDCGSIQGVTDPLLKKFVVPRQDPNFAEKTRAYKLANSQRVK
jgi:hypothetical protein